MLENRRHFRLREFTDVAWKVADQDVSGRGTLVNISFSGMLLRTDQIFRPTDNCFLTVESTAENFPFASKKGKMVWFRRIQAPQECFQCGLQFLGNEADNDFIQRLEMKINRISEAGDANILGNMAF
jgi:hypothetical protein